jgi:hypothetical protein
VVRLFKKREKIVTSVAFLPLTGVLVLGGIRTRALRVGFKNPILYPSWEVVINEKRTGILQEYYYQRFFLSAAIIIGKLSPQELVSIWHSFVHNMEIVPHGCSFNCNVLN